MNQSAEVKAKKSIYIVWIIPVIAMLLAGWMIFKHYDGKGFEVTVVFENGNGMTVGKTPLMYNGIKIGVVTDMQIHAGDISKVDVTITVDKKARGVSREGNVFWKVEPTVSLTEVTGLSTILSGVYIGVMPSLKDPAALGKLPEKFTFVAADEQPIDIFEPGLLVSLHANNSDIKSGAPILYKKITVGKVIDVELGDTGIDYLIHIDEEYTYLVKDNSKFWKISGLEIRASLAGIRVEMESLASVIAGGISLSSPKDGKAITEQRKPYKLFQGLEELDLDEKIITLVSSNGYNIDIKAAHIFFKGANAGDIVSLDYDPADDKTTFKIRLKSEFRHLANKNAHFWIVEPRIGLTAIKGLNAISSGPYISFETSSKSKELKSNFKLHVDPPELQGKHFHLISNESYNLKNGVNIVHKDIVIGRLHDFTLSRKTGKVKFDIVIADEYKHLINDSSNFYIQGAMEIGASFEGIYLNVGSITSMVNGGIVLKTQNLKSKLTRSKFDLFDSYKAYDKNAYLQGGGKRFKLITDKLSSVKDDSPILYKGLKVGKVVSFKLNKDSSKVELEIYIKKAYVDQVNESTSFYNVSGIQVKAGLDGVKIQTGSLESIVTGGIAFKTPLKTGAVKAEHKFTLYDDEDAVDEKYVTINFTTKDETGLKVGSAIIYKSVNIGQVNSMKLVDDEVKIEALINSSNKKLLAQDSIFWVEDVSINIDNIKNPSAILSGAFIKVLKGNSSEQGVDFELSMNQPVATLNKKGLRILVTGHRLSSLTVGSSVFYRQIKIGSVENIELSNDAKGVDIKLYIDKDYAYLIRENSLFYHAGALGVDVSLFGVKISTETMATMIKGGINVVTPDEAGAKVTGMTKFKLYDSAEEEWVEYEPELRKD